MPLDNFGNWIEKPGKSNPVYGDNLEYGGFNNPRDISKGYILPIHGEPGSSFDAIGRNVQPIMPKFEHPTPPNIPSSIVPPSIFPVSFPTFTDFGPGGAENWGPGMGHGPDVNNGIGPTSTDLGPGYGPYDMSGAH